jgi:nicotinamidase-related amidase
MPYLASRIALASLVFSGAAHTASAETIVNEWTNIRPPPPPALLATSPDPKTTALLVLDVVRQRCNADRPRCLAMIPPVTAMLHRAREAGIPVIYSLIAGTAAADVVPGLAPRPGDAVVTAGADKFLGTELEQILRRAGIKTIVIVGTAAEGVVLSTAGEAAMRGFAVVVPVDGMSSALPYAEQYTAWHLLNAPGPSGHVVLTRLDMVHF